MVCKSRLTRRHRRIFFPFIFFSSLLQSVCAWMQRYSVTVFGETLPGDVLCKSNYQTNNDNRQKHMKIPKTASQAASRHQNINRHCCEWEFILHHRHLRCTPVAHLNGIATVCSFPCHRKAAKIIIFFIFLPYFIHVYERGFFMLHLENWIQFFLLIQSIFISK